MESTNRRASERANELTAELIRIYVEGGLTPDEARRKTLQSQLRGETLRRRDLSRLAAAVQAHPDELAGDARIARLRNIHRRQLTCAKRERIHVARAIAGPRLQASLRAHVSGRTPRSTRGRRGTPRSGASGDPDPLPRLRRTSPGVRP